MSDAAPIVVATGVSKWYGHVLGVSDLTWTLRGGVVGLLGPNGAGKSTLMRMLAGLLRPSRGTLEVFGALPYDSVETRRRIGYAPEHEATWDELTALELVTHMARLAGVAPARCRAAAEEAIAAMGMTRDMGRPVRGYSKGMRQRTKLATAIAHQPSLLLLDEPLTGVDPIARQDIIARVRALADAGTTIVVSSHVLHEIEALTETVLVVHQGQVLAEGDTRVLRALNDRHPHRIRVECDRPRDVARRLAAAEHVVQLQLGARTVTVETRDPDRCYDDLAAAVLADDVALTAMVSLDNDLASLFEHLTGSAR